MCECCFHDRNSAFAAIYSHHSHMERCASHEYAKARNVNTMQQSKIKKIELIPKWIIIHCGKQFRI
jgi:hypothetical protein